MSELPRELRRFVKKRADGCCEYCLQSSEFDSIPYHVDHIVPQRHRGDTIESNLCLSCSTCNIMKGSEIGSYDPFDGEITRLFHPRIDFWSDHFELEGSVIHALTPVGRVTEFILDFNAVERIDQRQRLLRLGFYPCVPISSN
jgi:hypothetical protein